MNCIFRVAIVYIGMTLVFLVLPLLTVTSLWILLRQLMKSTNYLIEILFIYLCTYVRELFLSHPADFDETWHE